MNFTLATTLVSGYVHLMPNLTRDQLMNIMLETAPEGGLRNRVAQWITSTEPEFSGEDFAERPFTITRR